MSVWFVRGCIRAFVTQSWFTKLLRLCSLDEESEIQYEDTGGRSTELEGTWCLLLCYVSTLQPLPVPSSINEAPRHFSSGVPYTMLSQVLDFVPPHSSKMFQGSCVIVLPQIVGLQKKPDESSRSNSFIMCGDFACREWLKLCPRMLERRHKVCIF